MNATMRKERRRHRRYIVSGQVKLRTESFVVQGELVNFGQGGMLVRSGLVLLVGTQMRARVTAFCYPYAFDVAGEVVSTKNALMAIKFLEQPNGVQELLYWLEQENFPWTGTFDSITSETEQPWHCPSPALSASGSDTQLELEPEFVYQQA